MDMSLILLADPYANAPLPDSSEEIAAMVGQTQGQGQGRGHGADGDGGNGNGKGGKNEDGSGSGSGNGNGNGNGNGGMASEGYRVDQLAAQVGRHYARFAEEVNDAMEERDVALTVLSVSLQQS